MTTTWSDQYISVVRPLSCRLVIVRYLFKAFSFENFEGKWAMGLWGEGIV